MLSLLTRTLCSCKTYNCMVQSTTCSLSTGIVSKYIYMMFYRIYHDTTMRMFYYTASYLYDTSRN